MIKGKIASLLICTMIVASCAGREAATVAVVQGSDFDRNCDSLKLEIASNDSQIKDLIIEHTKKQGSNTALTVVGAVVFFPALFALDLKGAAKAEYQALYQRNVHLANVAEQRGCAPIKVKTLDDFKEEIAAERRANPDNQAKHVES